MEADRELEFRYSKYDTGRGHLKVGVNARCRYDKSLAFIKQLAADLLAAIPFSFTIVGEPEVRILGGLRVKGMMSVEMIISPSVGYEDAIAQLQQKWFSEGFEVVLA